MRQKGSQEYLHVAAAFANAVTVRENECTRDISAVPVDCRGRLSIFSALQVCLPHIARDNEGKIRDTVKGAISEAECNKFLAKSGYSAYRYRHRLKGVKDKWSKGVQRWKNIRWINPNNAEEAVLLQSQLHLLYTRFPVLCTSLERSVVDFLSKLKSSPDSDTPEVDGEEFENDSILGVEAIEDRVEIDFDPVGASHFASRAGPGTASRGLSPDTPGTDPPRLPPFAVASARADVPQPDPDPSARGRGHDDGPTALAATDPPPRVEIVPHPWASTPRRQAPGRPGPFPRSFSWRQPLRSPPCPPRIRLL